MARTVDQMLRVPISKKLLVDKNLNGCKIKIRCTDEQNLLIKFRYADGTTSEINQEKQQG
jgi:hypothetical protein